METWLPVVGWPDYEVSDLGRVRRSAPGRGARAGRVLASRPNRKGYLRVALRRGGVATDVFVHTAVLRTFVGPPALGQETNHSNGVKSDNRLANLEWLSPAENVQHAYATGLKVPARGEDNGRARLTAQHVREIRAAGGTHEEIAAQFGVSRQLVGAVRRGEVWTHVA